MDQSQENERLEAKNGILCAIRGGPASSSTINAAIGKAAASGRPLTFLYVVNLDFLTHTIQSRVELIVRDMKETGLFLLTLAQERAARAGVVADITVRQGDVGAELLAACQKLSPGYVFIGQPHPSDYLNTFSHAAITEFTIQLKAVCDAEIVQIP